jgi:hypothetical protein
MSNAPVSGNTKSSNILQFALKVFIVAIIISVASIYVAETIIEHVEFAIKQVMANSTTAIKQALGNSTGAPFWGRVERELDRAADPETDLALDKKQKILKDVHVIVARWRPVIDAIQSELQKQPEAKATNVPTDLK